MWSRYDADRSLDNRNALVEFYLPWLRTVARRMKRTLPCAEFGDLLSDGTLGLMQAVQRFDSGRNLKFETYATIRVRGSMRDGMRDRDDVPRLIRIRIAWIANATAALEWEHDRPPTEKEIARRLGISVDALRNWQRDAEAFPTTMSLNIRCYETDDYNKEVRQIDIIENPKAPQANERVDHIEWWSTLLRCLRRDEKVLFILYWRYDVTMKRIGQHLGMSESRISQMHAAALHTLQKYRFKVDFADIPKGGDSIKCLRAVFAYCHLRRRHQLPKPSGRTAAIRVAHKRILLKKKRARIKVAA